MARGTSNGNCRGNWRDRARRRKRILESYAADRSVLRITQLIGETETSFDLDVDAKLAEVTAQWYRDHGVHVTSVEVLPAVRCYRCGTVLTEDSLTIDRITPGAEGGTYTDANIRPACGTCNSATGGALGAARKKAS